MADTSKGAPAQQIPETKSPKISEQSEKKSEPERKIIKFDAPDKSADQNKQETEQKKQTTDIKKPDTGKTSPVPDVNKIIGDKNPGASADAAREELEQRRTILQNLKDFDFLIKKNQEDIGNLTEKVESLSKDLDDLVSLYEIVSEQMNPFVGLSKVTKKRLDALENITKEVDTIKSKIGDLETSLEKGGLTLEDLKKRGPSTPRNEVPSITATTQKAISPSGTPDVTSTISSDIQGYQDLNLNLSETELDEILSKSLEAFRIEQNIDSMITEFFLTLK